MEALEDPEVSRVLKDGLVVVSRRKEEHSRLKELCEREKAIDRAS